jgi:hypothetical protein
MVEIINTVDSWYGLYSDNIMHDSLLPIHPHDLTEPGWLVYKLGTYVNAHAIIK